MAVCILGAAPAAHAESCAPQAGAATLLPALDARAAAVSRLGPGTGTDVRLIPRPCGGFDTRADEGAAAEDMAWARAVTDADRLAIALGAVNLDVPLSVHNFPGQVGITPDGALPVAGADPGAVLARFLRARVRESNTVPLDTVSLMSNAPEDWPELVSHLRVETESDFILQVGGSRAIPAGDIVADTASVTVHTLHPGLRGDITFASNGAPRITLTSDQKVSRGTYFVYFYRGDSKFEPVARLDVTVIEPKPN